MSAGSVPLSCISREKDLKGFFGRWGDAVLGLQNGWAVFGREAKPGSKTKAVFPTASGERPQPPWSSRCFWSGMSWKPIGPAERPSRVSVRRPSNGNWGIRGSEGFPPCAPSSGSWLATGAPDGAPATGAKGEDLPIRVPLQSRSEHCIRPIWWVPDTCEVLTGSPVFIPSTPWMWPGTRQQPARLQTSRRSRSAGILWGHGDLWGFPWSPRWTTKWQRPEEDATPIASPRSSGCTCCWGSTCSLFLRGNREETPRWRVSMGCGKSASCTAIAVPHLLTFDGWIGGFLTTTITKNLIALSNTRIRVPAFPESFGIDAGSNFHICLHDSSCPPISMPRASFASQWPKARSPGFARWMGGDVLRSTARPTSSGSVCRVSM